MFAVPRGKFGTNFIKELSRLIYLFVDKTKWNRMALDLAHIFIPIMLQKPSSKSKAKLHAELLGQRLEKWKNGDIKSLLKECKDIQARLSKQLNAQKESNHKAFCRLMFAGKVGQAIRFINNDDTIAGVHELNNEVKSILTDKHPVGEEADEEVLLKITDEPPSPVIFEAISAENVKAAIMDLNGSGGPTLVDTDIWKHLICSRYFNKASDTLADAIAGLAKRLCQENIGPECLKAFTASRLIPLDKGTSPSGQLGVRPIGIGEVLRRIVGKCVVKFLRADIQQAAGTLQTCAGLKSGIEAAIHATRRIWDNEETEALLQVDADNAFNRLNRKVALHNIREICPPFYQFLANHYQVPSKLIINTNTGRDELLSQEGSTQGDVAAMAKYALGVTPLINTLGDAVDKDFCKQVWYADDSSALGKLKELLVWWNILYKEGPKYGYYPKPSKTVLIIKGTALLPEATMLFAGTGITISCEGERHLGAVIGSTHFREQYVKNKVETWVKDIQDLSQIATEEPQAALSAYTKGLCHR